MRFTEFSFILITITAINVYFQVRKSYRQGLSKTLIRLSVIIFCAFASAGLSILGASIAEESVLDWFYDTGAYESAEESLGSGVSVIPVFYRMLFPMLIYLPVFLVLKLLCDLIVAAVCRYFSNNTSGGTGAYYSENEDRYVKQNKVISATVGVFVGFVISAITFMPFVGSIKTAEHVVITIDHLIPDAEISDSDIVEEIDRYSDDVTVSIFYVCADKLLFDLSTTTSYKGETTNLNREIDVLEDVDILELQTILSSINDMEKDKADYIMDLLDESEDSVMLTELLLAFTKDSSLAWLGQEDYLGIERPIFSQHPSIDVFMDDVFRVLSKSTYKTIHDDIETIVNIAMILDESKRAFSSENYGAIFAGMSKYSVVSRIKGELEKNSHMKGLVHSVDGIVISIIADEIKSSGNYTQEQCDMLFEELADVIYSTSHLKGSARTTAVLNSAKKCFDACGISMPDEMNSSFVAILLAEFDSGNKNVDLEDVRDFFEIYNDAVSEFK